MFSSVAHVAPASIGPLVKVLHVTHVLGALLRRVTVGPLHGIGRVMHEYLVEVPRVMNESKVHSIFYKREMTENHLNTNFRSFGLII